MPVSGRKPKEGEKRNRVRPVHDWIEVANEPFEGPVPVKLPTKRVLSSPEGPYEVPVHPMTRQWWRTVSAMPHAVLWTASDWQFALATALVADDFHHRRTTAAVELRQREKILGMTGDARRDLRIRYVPPTDETRMRSPHPLPTRRIAFSRGPFRRPQWSGGGANRFAAIPIPVRANEITPYDVKLSKGVTLTGRITGPAGQPPGFAEISVVNAKSFDTMSRPEVGPDGRFTARLIGPQDVKLHIIASAGGLLVVRWYPDAPDFAHGRPVSTPDSGAVSEDIPITGG